MSNIKVFSSLSLKIELAGIIIIFIYTAHIQRTFSNAPYNSKSITILKSNLQIFTILSSNQIKSNQIKCWFLRRGENRSTRTKTSQSRAENQPQPTYDAESGNRTRDTLVEGERYHHCANPAPQIRLLQQRLSVRSHNVMFTFYFVVCGEFKNKENDRKSGKQEQSKLRKKEVREAGANLLF